MNFLTSINWNYTYKCNFNCSHCYSRSPAFPKELEEKDYDKIITELIDSKIFRVAFGGGEPLFRKDFLKTITRLGEAGIFTHFTTNGWYFTEEIVTQLEKAKVGFISFSLDGITSDEHDFVRNQVGSYSRVINGIKLCVERGITSYISVTVTKRNCHLIEQFVNTAESLGVTEINFKVFRPAGNGLVLKDEFGLQQNELERIIEQVSCVKKTSKVRLSMFGKENTKGCSCGITTLTLRPNGDLVICPYSNQVVGNLFHESLIEIWNQSPILVLRRKSTTCYGEQDNEWPMASDIDIAKSNNYTSKLKLRYA